MANANPATRGTPQVTRPAPAVVVEAAVVPSAVVEAVAAPGIEPDVVAAPAADAIAPVAPEVTPAFTVAASVASDENNAPKGEPKNAVVTDSGKGYIVTTYA